MTCNIKIPVVYIHGSDITVVENEIRQTFKDSQLIFLLNSEQLCNSKSLSTPPEYVNQK